MDSQRSEQILVRDAPDRSRFEITLDGALVGFVEYRSRPGRIVFTHTQVDDAHQGRGLAGTLVRAALNTVRRRGLEVTRCAPTWPSSSAATPSTSIWWTIGIEPGWAGRRVRCRKGRSGRGSTRSRSWSRAWSAGWSSPWAGQRTASRDRPTPPRG